MDAREHAQREARARWRFKTITVLTVFGFFIGCVAILHHSTVKVKVKSSTVVQRVIVPKTIYKTRLVPIPHNDDPSIGSMSSKEFASIVNGMKGDYVDSEFGDPMENIPNDNKTFYPAAEGGTYWIYYSHGKGSGVQHVVGKEYVK